MPVNYVEKLFLTVSETESGLSCDRNDHLTSHTGRSFVQFKSFLFVGEILRKIVDHQSRRWGQCLLLTFTFFILFYYCHSQQLVGQQTKSVSKETFLYKLRRLEPLQIGMVSCE